MLRDRKLPPPPQVHLPPCLQNGSVFSVFNSTQAGTDRQIRYSSYSIFFAACFTFSFSCILYGCDGTAGKDNKEEEEQEEYSDNEEGLYGENLRNHSYLLAIPRLQKLFKNVKNLPQLFGTQSTDNILICSR